MFVSRVLRSLVLSLALCRHRRTEGCHVSVHATGSSESRTGNVYCALGALEMSFFFFVLFLHLFHCCFLTVHAFCINSCSSSDKVEVKGLIPH